MIGKINDAYAAALLNGLANPSWLQLDDTGRAVLEKAKQIIGQEGGVTELAPLKSITGQVWNQNAEYYFTPGRLSIGELSVFPTTQKPSIDSQDIKQKISTEIETLYNFYQTKSKAFNYSLYHTTYAWGSRVAFDKPDVSAFDHNRLLAATVACLNEGTDQFFLLKGAISGIQNFIYYDIGGEQIDDAKKTSKRLRGRSFLVAYLCQVIAEHIVERLNLEQANILFVGGGHFNLLLPASEHIEKALRTLRKDLNLGLFDNVGMQLSLLLEWEEAGSDLFSNAAKYYGSVNSKLEYAKQKKHGDYLTPFFHQGGKKHDTSVDDADEDLGQAVPHAQYVLEIQAAKAYIDSLESKWKIAIDILQFVGNQYYLFKNQQDVESFLKDHGQGIINTGGLIKLVQLNKTDLINIKTEIPLARGFLFIGNEAPKEGERIKTFEDIAAMSDKGDNKLSYPQLAAMRLDVDDLGVLFGYGLGKNATFERIAALSREFQLFFGGYFNKLAEENHLYITYSGGDDAFVIGSWLNVVHFAEELNDAFRKFTCQNKNIGFSAGIFLCNPFYPVVRFADDAALLLDNRAKKYGIKSDEHKGVDTAIGKDAVCLFNRTMSWSRFKEVMEFARDLSVVVPRQNEENKENNLQIIRRSMLQHLLKIIQTSVKEQRVYKNEFEFYRNIGRLHGLVSRHGYNKAQLDKSRDQDRAATIVRKLLQESNSPERFADFMVPLQYVLHQTRVINE